MGNGRLGQVGIDPVVGLNQHLCLSQSLIDYLQDFGIQTLSQARIGCDLSTFRSYLFSAKDLDLSGDLNLEWERYVSSLYSVGLHLSKA